MHRPSAVVRLLEPLFRAACVAVLFASLAVAGPQGEESASAQISRSSVVETLKGLEAADSGVSAERVESLRVIYQNALIAIDARAASNKQEAKYKAEATGAAAEIAEIQALLAAGIEPEIPPTDGLSLLKLEALRDEAELQVSEAQTTVEAGSNEGPDRRAQIADELAEVAVERAEVESKLSSASPLAEDDGLAAALRLQFKAEEEKLIARAAELRVEEATYSTRRELRRERSELARQQSEAKAATLRALDSALNAARQAEAEAQREEAIRQVEETAMKGERFAERGAEVLRYRNETLRLAGKLEVESQRIDTLQKTHLALKRRFEQTQRRISIAGLSRDTGFHLRRERQLLLDRRTTRQQLEDARNDATRNELELFEVDASIAEIENDELFVSDLVQAAAAEGQTGKEVEALAVRIRGELLAALEALQKMLTERSTDLLDIARLKGMIIESQEVYEGYVAERILWIRSSDPLWKVSRRDLEVEIERLPSLETVPLVIGALDKEFTSRPLIILLVALALLTLIAARLRVNRALAEEGDLARLRSQVSIMPTLRAAALSLIVAAPYGAVLYAISWVAGSSSGGGELTLALGEACSRAAAAALIIGALRALTAKDGLEEAHFDAEPDAVRLVRTQTNWLLPVMPTAALVGEFMATLDAGSTADALARTAFLIEVGSLLLFTWRVLSPKRGVLAINARHASSGDFLTRLRRFWFILAVTVLGALAVLAILGYGFTARSLFTKFELSVGLVLLLVTIRSIALRWIRLIHRREAMEKLLKKRKEQREKRLAEIERRRNAGEDVGELESEGLEVEEEELNLASISSDLKNLIRMVTLATAVGGAFWIWSSVLPALGAFDRIELWNREVSLQDANGVMTPALEPVTLANVGLALLILLVTWRAVRDLPSLLEIILLRRLQLGSGERYAITTLLRYFLITIGVLFAFDKFGLAWSQLQWLVAGVSVGLGFGLQEIFANFVSGITLLFERPVRVGDWVTLGDIEGVVSKIRIRATTIRDRDLKELIVPNREFITGRFINWTLSDPVSRVTANVGIAYGSDTEKAIQLLLEAGRECPYSVSEPAPNVVFMSFGDSALDFELRVFVSGREIKPRVLHDLHMRIDLAFRKADIEISFPQRDLHLRTAPGLGELEKTLRKRD